MGVAPDAIVGRRRELDALRAWLDAARGGAGRLILCAWGRCGQGEGAPAFWPWRQVLRSLGVDTDGILATEAESSQDRFRVVDDLSEAVLAAVYRGGLVIILDDIQLSVMPIMTPGSPSISPTVTRCSSGRLLGRWRTAPGVRTGRLAASSTWCGHGSTASPRDFPLPLVARALDEPVAQCLPVIDEAIAYGLVDCVSHIGDYRDHRFVHALTREAVEASTADRTALHRAVAAVRRLAFEEGARLYRAALALPATPPSAIDRCRLLIALGRPAYFAGDLQGCLERTTPTDRLTSHLPLIRLTAKRR